MFPPGLHRLKDRNEFVGPSQTPPNLMLGWNSSTNSTMIVPSLPCGKMQSVTFDSPVSGNSFDGACQYALYKRLASALHHSVKFGALCRTYVKMMLLKTVT
ncbi:hypothetical protein DKX38_026334 [Salix brachista]|uniref:Uncharacterized protein n=1 Tax=Salix brachista TaxID=2182728 RepID=A0A5N5JB83_9ROSI|nr:hypothetical protein DKX38_026334 [Salix brachista]